MYKNKTSYYYLERGFPENLRPAFTNRSTKRKRFLVERKKRILKRSIRKGLRTLVKPLFSAPTKKGLLLEKSSDRFRVFSDVFSEEKNNEKTAPFLQEKRDNLQKKFAHATENRTVLQKQEGLHLQGKCRRYKFLFPLHRLKGELLKRESQYGKIELYKKQIQEKRKLAFLYGKISKNSINKLIKQARNLSSTESSAIKGLVTLLESRLDVVLFRASFFSSVPMARQWISHGKVTINKKKVRAPSYQLRGGDCIEVLSTCALPLKDKMRRRVTEILPFRRSRKKLVTPSLVETFCSFEKIFPKEKESFRVAVCSSLCKQSKLNAHDEGDSLQVSRSRLGLFSEEKRKTQSKNNNPVKILTTPTVIESFSQMKDHLQSIWEKSVQSSFFSNRKKDQGSPVFSGVFSKGKNNEKTTMTNGKIPFVFSSEKTTTFSRSDYPSTKRRNKRDTEKVFDKKWGKTRTSFARILPALQRGVTLFGRLKKREVETLDFLNAKQVLIQPRNRMQKLAGLQVSAIKPLHLEISYRLLAAIFLYSPQKVAYPGNLDLPLIIKLFK